MASFLGFAWWVIAAALVGWMCSWLFASLLKREVPSHSEKVVDKFVDLEREHQLETATPDISGKENRPEFPAVRARKTIERFGEKLNLDAQQSERDKRTAK